MRNALVTGGTRGIGEAISVGLKKAGYKVAATYVGNDERAKAFAEKHGISPHASADRGLADQGRYVVADRSGDLQVDGGEHPGALRCLVVRHMGGEAGAVEVRDLGEH